MAHELGQSGPSPVNAPQCANLGDLRAPRLHPLQAGIGSTCAKRGLPALHASEAKIASDPTREIDPRVRMELARADLARPGNVWIAADQHRGKGLLSTSTSERENAREVERNFRASTKTLRRHCNVTAGLVLLGDLSDSKVPYRERREIVLASARAYSEALGCAQSDRWIALLLGNHEVERATELRFSVRGEERRLPLFAGRLMPREYLRQLAIAAQGSGLHGVMVSPHMSDIAPEIQAQLRTLNQAFGRDENEAMPLTALSAVIPDFEKLNELSDALGKIPGVKVLQRTHRVGTLLEIFLAFRLLIAHDPIVNGENIGRILTHAERNRRTVRLSSGMIKSLIIGDQHTNGLVESKDFDTVSVGSLGGALSRERGNPPTMVCINPEGSGRANFWNISDPDLLFPIQFEDIGYIAPTYHLDDANVAQMFDGRNVVGPGHWRGEGSPP